MLLPVLLVVWVVSCTVCEQLSRRPLDFLRELIGTFVAWVHDLQGRNIGLLFDCL